MNKNIVTLTAILSGFFAMSNLASAASIEFDEASNLPQSARAYEESNSPKVTDTGLTGVTLSQRAEKTGSAPSDRGLLNFDGIYSSSSAFSGGPGTTKTFSFNIYDPSSEGGKLSDTLFLTLTKITGSTILVTGTFTSDSLSGYLPTALNLGTVTNITETGLVQQAFNQYGLKVDFRSDVPVPVPAAAFFVAPALAGVLGFSRRKRSVA